MGLPRRSLRGSLLRNDGKVRGVYYGPIKVKAFNTVTGWLIIYSVR